ncbi:serine protease [Streptomyces cinnamoneus]|uniref:Serine protease n=1 Tax=Streptomyces cinnamoneus TaxID=53446 RepID=A0A2G1XLX3_STRCJ|nr:S1 family peptidase [Streptomyces cinnamoneus]PHQ52139.1 serine protease [Streptomyces cinnamoneus]PPT16219.1 S1 family peptidase [Streptomyces cinnamoneus]
MNGSRIPKRRAALAAAGTLALTAASLTLQSAQAASGPAPSALSALRAGELAQHIAADLGPATAGSYYDASAGKLVVTVVDEAAAARVRATGAVARQVKHSAAELASARETLAARATVPGTAWSVDPRTNQVVVTADRTVTGAALQRLQTVVAGLGDKARIKRTSATLRPYVAGGDAIWGSGVRCSLGFNVTKSGKPYFLTAGHCGNASSSWSASQGGSRVGTTETSSFPGHDYALVRYASGASHPSAVDLYDGGSQNISRAAEATVGEQVQRSGSTTQVHGGEVTGLDATVNYEEGTVEGLIDTTVCAEPGDSGGALFDGDAALGLTSGGSGDCSSGGETFFQPVPAALQAVGAQIP